VESGLTPEQVSVPFDPDADPDGDPDVLFLRAARPVLNQLAVDLSGANISVVLADALGRILDHRMASGRAARPDAVPLTPGFVYAEAAVGTNAVGTALALRKPVAVEGGEHFADALITIAGAGAPILDVGNGELLGVIALVSLAGQGSWLMLPLATGAAREVEYRLAEAGGLGGPLALQRFRQDRQRTRGPGARRTKEAHRSFGWVSLTDGERRVIDLVSNGLTNREAAKLLFLSHYTVDSHLRSIFRKLGVSSRVELTRVAVERKSRDDAFGPGRLADSFAPVGM
jgi:DNA-binding CsgD family transcriptional regulator